MRWWNKINSYGGSFSAIGVFCCSINWCLYVRSTEETFNFKLLLIRFKTDILLKFYNFFFYVHFFPLSFRRKKKEKEAKKEERNGCDHLLKIRSKAGANFGYKSFRNGLPNISGFSKKSFDCVEKKYSKVIPVDVRTRYTVSLYALVENGCADFFRRKHSNILWHWCPRGVNVREVFAVLPKAWMAFFLKSAYSFLTWM